VILAVIFVILLAAKLAGADYLDWWVVALPLAGAVALEISAALCRRKLRRTP